MTTNDELEERLATLEAAFEDLAKKAKREERKQEDRIARLEQGLRQAEAQISSLRR